MRHLTPPIPFTDYQLDPATDNSHLWKVLEPKGLTDKQRRIFFKATATQLDGMAIHVRSKYAETGLAYFDSFADLIQQEADECRNASKRKYIDRQP